MTILFASQNKNKRDEIQAILGDVTHIISLSDLGFREELPETHSTLEENALEKAQFVFEKFHADCFSEDTGLGIDALNGEPGVLSARYAGESKNAADNVRLVLKKMKNISDRAARFKTVVCLKFKYETYFFEGIVDGKILEEARGHSGFGYDPIFIPEGYRKSFAEMTDGEKNRISHRGKAILSMKQFLEEMKEV